MYNFPDCDSDDDETFLAVNADLKVCLNQSTHNIVILIKLKYLIHKALDKKCIKELVSQFQKFFHMMQ